MRALSTVAVVLCLCVCCLGAKPPLRFNSDGKFKIVQFTDLHFGESLAQDLLSQTFMHEILKWEKPDLVALTGDAVSGYGWPKSHPKDWFAKIFKRVAHPMDRLGIPWAYTLGNHDREADLNDRECVQVAMTYDLSYTQLSDASIGGASNYWLDILRHDTDVPGGRLLFLDSGEHNCEGVGGYGCAEPTQVEWYRQYNKTVPVSAYFHIPIPEYMNLWNNFGVNGTFLDSGVCCFSVNTGLFAAMKEQQDVLIMSVGHDHTNDFLGDYYGITLAYGRKSGFGGYFSKKMKRGARVIVLEEDVIGYETYIREDFGKVVKTQPYHAPGTNRHDICCGAVGGAASLCDAYVEDYLSQRDNEEVTATE